MAEEPDEIIQASAHPTPDPTEMNDLGGLLGGLDLGNLLGAAQEMQQQMAEAQERIAETVVEGQAGGGVVKVSATGAFQFTSVHISTAAVDPDDPTMLEDLVLAALHDLASGIEELHSSASPLGGMDLGGMDLGAIGGMLGGA
jgi:DNA-binding YbaB/EbfC family protein